MFLVTLSATNRLIAYLWELIPSMPAFRSLFPLRRIELDVEALGNLNFKSIDYSKFHVISGDDPNSAEVSTEKVPEPRSGHRIFVTDDYLFVIGGYDKLDGGRIYKEVWRMNLLTRMWNKMEIADATLFPAALASFAICQLAPYSNKIILFGGTDLPFGQVFDECTFLMSMEPDGTVVSKRLEVSPIVSGVYGHAMIRSDEGSSPQFYSIGGTTGRHFFLDIDCLTSNQGEWKWTRTGVWEGLGADDPLGLYRLECVFDKGLLVMLGGGTPSFVQGFQRLITFEPDSRNYGHVNCQPDATAGFPKARRCHSVTQWGRKVVVVGGCSEDHMVGNDPALKKVEIYGDVWMLDLDSFQWTKHHVNLDIAVFFHAAAITKDGCLLVHGGVADEMSTQRVNALQAMWLEPPRLYHLSSRVVFKAISKKSKSKKRSKTIEKPEKDFTFTKPQALVRRVLLQ